MKIEDNRFLITGGAGLMGSHIAERILELGAKEINILDNFSRGSMDNIKELIADPRVRLIKGDIRDLKLLRDLCASTDGVFHMAALRITACAENPREAMEVMLFGLHNLIEAMAENDVKRLVYASSASVYGLANSFPTNESHHPYNNRTYYGAAKIAGEGMIRSFSEMYDLRYVALRYFNVFGPRMDVYGKYTEVLIRWIDRISAGQPPVIFGEGSQTMDLVNIKDVTEANILAMQSELTDEVFNIGSGTETSLLALLYSLLSVMQSDLKPQFLPERAVNPVPRRLADTTKAERLLGFKANVTLEEGLRTLVAWRRTLSSLGDKRNTVPIQTIDNSRGRL